MKFLAGGSQSGKYSGKCIRVICSIRATIVVYPFRYSGIRGIESIWVAVEYSGRQGHSGGQQKSINKWPTRTRTRDHLLSRRHTNTRVHFRLRGKPVRAINSIRVGQPIRAINSIRVILYSGIRVSQPIRIPIEQFGPEYLPPARNMYYFQSTNHFL